MNWTRKQYIEIIEDYIPVRDMKDLSILIRESVKSECPELEMEEEVIWRDLPDRVIEKLAHLCASESNDFYRKYASTTAR